MAGTVLYYPVVPDLNKPPYRETKVYLNRGGGVNPQTGIRIDALCKGFEPVFMGSSRVPVYVVQAPFFNEKKACMDACVERGRDPIIGPFSDLKQAIVEAVKRLPKSVEETLRDQIAEKDRELAELRESKGLPGTRTEKAKTER